MASNPLADEHEAINAIYGPGTLIGPSPGPDPGTYVLRLPRGASSLRLRFPSDYPQVPPVVVGTERSSHGLRGAASRDAALLAEILSAVFHPGSVCLFDALDEFETRSEARQEGEESVPLSGSLPSSSSPPPPPRPPPHALHLGPDKSPQACQASASAQPAPSWFLSDPVTENKSTFVARVCAVTSPSLAHANLAHLLASDKRIRSATHNITAWRIRGAGAASFQDYDDDGETAAGARLLHLMQLMDLWDAMVVVTRWYGGVKLGPRRFAVINSVARNAFVRAGMVVDRKRDAAKR